MEISKYGCVRNANRDRRFTHYMVCMVFFVRIIIGQVLSDPEKTSSALDEDSDGSDNIEIKYDLYDV